MGGHLPCEFPSVSPSFHTFLRCMPGFITYLPPPYCMPLVHSPTLFFPYTFIALPPCLTCPLPPFAYYVPPGILPLCLPPLPFMPAVPVLVTVLGLISCALCLCPHFFLICPSQPHTPFVPPFPQLYHCPDTRSGYLQFVCHPTTFVLLLPQHSFLPLPAVYLPLLPPPFPCPTLLVVPHLPALPMG